MPTKGSLRKTARPVPFGLKTEKRLTDLKLLAQGFDAVFYLNRGEFTPLLTQYQIGVSTASARFRALRTSLLLAT